MTLMLQWVCRSACYTCPRWTIRTCSPGDNGSCPEPDVGQLGAVQPVFLLLRLESLGCGC